MPTWREKNIQKHPKLSSWNDWAWAQTRTEATKEYRRKMCTCSQHPSIGEMLKWSEMFKGGCGILRINVKNIPLNVVKKNSAFVLNQNNQNLTRYRKKDAIIFSPKNQNNSSFEIYLWPFRFILFSIFTVNSSYENWPELYLFCSSFENCHKFGVCVSGAMKTFFFFWYT